MPLPHQRPLNCPYLLRSGAIDALARGGLVCGAAPVDLFTIQRYVYSGEWNWKPLHHWDPGCEGVSKMYTKMVPLIEGSLLGSSRKGVFKIVMFSNIDCTKIVKQKVPALDFDEREFDLVGSSSFGPRPVGVSTSSHRLAQDSIHRRGQNPCEYQYWDAKTSSGSGRSAESAALISAFYVLNKNPTQPVRSRRTAAPWAYPQWLERKRVMKRKERPTAAQQKRAEKDALVERLVKSHGMVQLVDNEGNTTGPPLVRRCPITMLACCHAFYWRGRSLPHAVWSAKP
jgi:hypothetical protein